MIRQAVAAEPDNAAYRDSLGWVLFRLGKYPQAVAELKKAAADKTVDGTVLEHLGDAYAKLEPARRGRRGLAPSRRGVPEREGNAKGRSGGEEN